MKRYFYGFYFKLQSRNETLALIPSFSIAGKEKSASLQVITKDHSYVVDYKYEEYSKGKDFECIIGKNHFSKDGIILDIDNDDIRIKGEIKFGKLNRLKKNIMGPFRFVPFLECIHTVVSIKHNINGTIMLNDKALDFSNGQGYIEGDKGRSFPSVYLWTHAMMDNGSIMLSVANIPFGFVHFTGIIGFVNYDNETIIFGTYNRAKAIKIQDGEVVIRQGKYILCVTQIEKNEFPLAAPVTGKMDRIIKESAECSVRYKLMKKDEAIFDKTINNASFEYEYTKEKEFDRLK